MFRFLTQPAIRQWLVFTLVALLALTGVFVAAGHYGTAEADRLLTARGEATAQLQVAALGAELDKQRAVRFVIARDADVIAALEQPSGAALAELNAKLETLNDGARANVIYIVNANGIAVASSNYRSDTSFVGNDYRFRAYFQGAMDNGTAQLFARGTVSRRPGLYIAERIEGADGPIGVAVVKLEFDALEAIWEAADGATYVTDRRGVVLLSDVDGWQFFTRTQLDQAQQAALRMSLQFGEAPLQALPVSPPDPVGPVDLVAAIIPPGERSATALRLTMAVPTIDWTLSLLLPVAAERSATIGTAQALGSLGLLPVVLGAGLLLAYFQRNQRARQALAAQGAALEAAVAARTIDLEASNRQLTRAMGEREQAEQRAMHLRDELAQSNRLAVLGQIAAGVAHEINQPVGAIRAYAENGVALLGRQDQATARENFSAIAGLTERVGAITEQLRGFGRKSALTTGPTDLDAAIGAALTLLGSNIRNRAVRVTYQPRSGLMVEADRLGLEQIIINLVQNALEALEDRPEPHIQLAITVARHTITLAIADNGPGIAPDIYEQLFIPFSTSKPKGLGLGLVISHDLAQSFGGTLAAQPNSGTGACFTLTLRRAA